MTAEKQVIEKGLRLLLRVAIYDRRCPCNDCKTIREVRKTLTKRKKRK